MSQVEFNSAHLGRLMDMAADAKGKRLGDIYLAVTSLVEYQDTAFSPRERTLATDILRRLSKDVEMTIRIGLAERMADSSEAPHDLILLLADDSIEVARPILARSPVLSDSDLLHIIEVGTNDHHIAVAERPDIGEPVTAALAKLPSDPVIFALLGNSTAKISNDTFGHLSDRAQLSPILQEPLANRPDLPPAVAQRMYQWVSGALKTALSQRYPQATQSIAQAVEETSAALISGKQVGSEEGASKLVGKLANSGQLKPSFLIRVLHQGQMDLFEHGFASLLDVDVEIIRRALFGERIVLLALACRAVGIDRAVFMTVFNLSRQNRRGSRLLSESDQKDIQDVYRTFSKAEALVKFKTSALA